MFFFFGFYYVTIILLKFFFFFLSISTNLESSPRSVKMINLLNFNDLQRSNLQDTIPRK